MSQDVKTLDAIPMMSPQTEIAEACAYLSRLLNRRTGCHRDKCRDIAVSAVFSALADANDNR